MWQPGIYLLFQGRDVRLSSIVAEITITILLVNYACSLLRYHWLRSYRENVQGKLPPQYPFLFPPLGAGISLAWNTGEFMRCVTYVPQFHSRPVALKEYQR
jgi:hypothetical protein